MRLMGFQRGVTVEGGLPIPVATPAHGTAFDIVGQGKASLQGLYDAFRVAWRMGISLAHRRGQHV
jgi:4-hydroxythreonine-4-phosphate dehydrogenase